MTAPWLLLVGLLPRCLLRRHIRAVETAVHGPWRIAPAQSGDVLDDLYWPPTESGDH